MPKMIISALASIIFFVGTPALALAQTAGTYAVTITNLTRGQSFTPILVASHLQNFAMFTAGPVASEALSLLAEGGDTGPMTTVLQDSGSILDIVTAEGLLNPGKSVTVMVAGDDIYPRISVAAMLIPTNDAFFAIQGMKLPKNNKTRIGTAIAYDAGSEPNDESCTSIPGPICNGEGPSPAAGGEGFIHVHAGIHGIGDLVAADRDWRNPVALITIVLVSESGNASN